MFSAIALSAFTATVAGCVVAVLVFSLKMPLLYTNAQSAIAFSFDGLPIVIILYQLVPLTSYVSARCHSSRCGA